MYVYFKWNSGVYIAARYDREIWWLKSYTNWHYFIKTIDNEVKFTQW